MHPDFRPARPGGAVHNHGAEEGPGLACLTGPIGDCIRLELEQLQRRVSNAETQVEYMTVEIAKALGQEPGTPADTVWMVRQLRTALAGRPLSA